MEGFESLRDAVQGAVDRVGSFGVNTVNGATDLLQNALNFYSGKPMSPPPRVPVMPEPSNDANDPRMWLRKLRERQTGRTAAPWPSGRSV